MVLFKVLKNVNKLTPYEEVFNKKGCRFFMSADAGINPSEAYKYILQEVHYCKVGVIYL